MVINVGAEDEMMDFYFQEDRITESNDPEYPGRYVPLNDFDYTWLPTPPALWVSGIDVINN